MVTGGCEAVIDMPSNDADDPFSIAVDAV